MSSELVRAPSVAAPLTATSCYERGAATERRPYKLSGEEYCD